MVISDLGDLFGQLANYAARGRHESRFHLLSIDTHFRLRTGNASRAATNVNSIGNMAINVQNMP